VTGTSPGDGIIPRTRSKTAYEHEQDGIVRSGTANEAVLWRDERQDKPIGKGISVSVNFEMAPPANMFEAADFLSHLTKSLLNVASEAAVEMAGNVCTAEQVEALLKAKLSLVLDDVERRTLDFIERDLPEFES
jgi:hypothetical protein